MKLQWDPKTKRFHEMSGKRRKPKGRRLTLLELVAEAERHADFRFDGQTATTGPR